MNNPKFKYTVTRLICVLLLFFGINGRAFSQIPERPNPPRLVNDLAGILSQDEKNGLEQKLVDFADTTSNQIAVVIVPELYGMDVSMLAVEIGQKWGVGQKKFDNGIVILVKPKTEDSRGDAFIAVGYGLEGVLPDALAKRVVETDMIPFFRDSGYYEGIRQAVLALMPLLAGEISTDEFARRRNGGDDTSASVFGTLFVLGFVILFFYLVFGGNNGSNLGSGNKGGGGRRKGLSAWELFLLASLLSGDGDSRTDSGRRGGSNGGSDGGFGSGGFGGGYGGGYGGGFGGGFGGGGFGGFGGGGFGGGGAGGSW